MFYVPTSTSLIAQSEIKYYYYYYLWDRFCSFCCCVPRFGAESRVAFRMFILHQYWLLCGPASLRIVTSMIPLRLWIWDISRRCLRGDYWVEQMMHLLWQEDLIITTEVIFVQHAVCFKARFCVIIKRPAKPGANI